MIVGSLHTNFPSTQSVHSSVGGVTTGVIVVVGTGPVGPPQDDGVTTLLDELHFLSGV